MLDRSIDGMCRLFGMLMVACLALMVLMVFGNVVLRYGFNSGITVSEELSRWLFVWMTFLGAIVAVRKHAHLGTDALVSRLPLAGKKVCFAAAHGLMLYVCWLMGRGSWQQTVINLETTSAVMEVPMAWLYASGVVFAVLAGALILIELLRLVTGRLPERELIGVAESDDMPHGQPADKGQP
ncbi:TRAP transporter small permease [Piscinibacter gummiphilus]|uniref:TRAP transporter small permease protein n=1 Tax=Piscinibacter gummiphilus TaxID=946333 RepID=A0ABZ0CXR9_9BURK|nr:TRAP transporter small permease [Piscinibacter gummiphilus]WOB07767.1 TRAP transporter small permease [Piscinibacter gummiphilus]